jgi:hypothetical protein
MTKLESQQLMLEKEVREASKETPIAASPHKGKRRREVPSALQGKIRRVHASFDDDVQLDLTQPYFCRINSNFNCKVIDAIIEAIGTEDYPETLIRSIIIRSILCIFIILCFCLFACI